MTLENGCAMLGCIDIVLTNGYNGFMENTKYYEIHSINGLTFRFKLDLNPLTGKYEPHIWHRHQIEPEQAVTAYLNATETCWNFKHNRFESYSQSDDINVWFNYFSPDKTKIMIITAFKI